MIHENDLTHHFSFPRFYKQKENLATSSICQNIKLFHPKTVTKNRMKKAWLGIGFSSKLTQTTKPFRRKFTEKPNSAALSQFPKVNPRLSLQSVNQTIKKSFIVQPIVGGIVFQFFSFSLKATKWDHHPRF